MSEDRSRYYRMKLFDPTGAEVSKKLLRIYPEDENGKRYAEMQGAKLGVELGLDAIAHANPPVPVMQDFDLAAFQNEAMTWQTIESDKTVTDNRRLLPLRELLSVFRKKVS
jgi:hypothetical protein